MSAGQIHPSDSTDVPDAPLLIVTGATLAAERHDRPAAYRLSSRITEILSRREEELGVDLPLRPLVCSDVWWLNDAAVRESPTVAIGAPEVNALTAYLADKLPAAFAIDDQMMVQMDVELADTLAACWGSTHDQTERAVMLFAEKYLDAFLEAALRERAG